MRIFGSAVLLLTVSATLVGAERFSFELEWGFGPKASEMYWDGTFRVTDGQLITLEPISFEPDRHDRIVPPAGFHSFTLDGKTDGLHMVIEGDATTKLQLDSKEGTFQWTVGELIEKGELRFRSRSKGKLIVRMAQTLVAAARQLSAKTTQDSGPVLCRLGDGRQLILWRAFVPARSQARSAPDAAQSNVLGTDQIQGVVIGEKVSGTFLQDRRSEMETQTRRFLTPCLTGDVESIAAAPVGEQACQVVWAEQRAGDWELYGRLVTAEQDQVKLGSTLRLTQSPGIDRSPKLARSPHGALVLVWQAWRDKHSSILCSVLQTGDEQEDATSLSATFVSDNAANDWDPAVAVSKKGTIAVAWSSWRQGSYDIHLRLQTDGKWGPVTPVASGDEFEAHPSLTYDADGVLWIAYDEGRVGWGSDSHTDGLRSRRNVRLRILQDGKIEEPTGTAAMHWPDKFVDHSEMPHLAMDGQNVVWLFFRHLTGRGVWKLMGRSLSDLGWSPPASLPNAAGGQDVIMASSLDQSGNLVLAWPSDNRTNQVGGKSDIYQAVLSSRNRRERSPSGKTIAASIKEVSRRKDRPTISFGSDKLALYFGDLHRHTELSVCQTGRDGSLEDAYRYAIDAAQLDFLCITDHVQHVKILNNYDFWRSGKTADLHRVPGVHEPLYGYERSQRWPYGHRNIISPTRNPKRVPRTADNRPWSANSGYPGEVRVTPPQLWEKLAGENVITIPHTSGSAVMGTNFPFPPGLIESVVEIYQGCRYSYEYPNAPDPRSDTRDPHPFRGGIRAGGSIWDALGKGYRYGFIASSDHLATHDSYTCVWATEYSPRAVLDAISKRRCYAATDNIVCDVRMGTHFMGSEFTASQIPPMKIQVTGTTKIARIDVIKDNQIVHTHSPKPSSAHLTFTFHDADASPAVHYYYCRVIQKDRNMAWTSPIWVNLKPVSK